MGDVLTSDPILESLVTDVVADNGLYVSNINDEFKFMNKMVYTKIRDVKDPVRAHDTDAGIDFFVPNDYFPFILKLGEDALIPSGIKVVIPEGYALIFMEKSGVATKKRLQIGAKVVDSSYRGEVNLHVFNTGRGDVSINPGDKIVQGIILPVSLFSPLEISKEEYEKRFANTDRGNGGFGSTGTN